VNDVCIGDTGESHSGLTVTTVVAIVVPIVLVAVIVVVVIDVFIRRRCSRLVKTSGIKLFLFKQRSHLIDSFGQ